MQLLLPWLQLLLWPLLLLPLLVVLLLPLSCSLAAGSHALAPYLCLKHKLQCLSTAGKKLCSWPGRAHNKINPAKSTQPENETLACQPSCTVLLLPVLHSPAGPPGCISSSLQESLCCLFMAASHRLTQCVQAPLVWDVGSCIGCQQQLNTRNPATPAGTYTRI